MTIFAWLRIIYAAALLLTTVIGWRWGGRSERWGVAIMVAASLATVAVMGTPFFDWRSRLGPLVAVDVLALLALLVLTLKTTKFWPIWATSFHLIAVGTHGAVHILPISLRQTYALLQGFWAYPMMVCIIIGALSHRAKMVDKHRI
jgi:hypothetical protein